MEVYGDIEAMKKIIGERYEAKITAIGMETNTAVEAIERETSEKISLMRADALSAIKSEIHAAKSKAMGEKKLEAKRVFELEREGAVEAVLCGIEKRKEKIALSKEYIDYVKANMPGKGKTEIYNPEQNWRKPGSAVSKDSTQICQLAVAVGGSEKYKTAFGCKVKIDKGIAGIVFTSENAIHDFTISKMVEAKRDVLREAIMKNLMGEKQ